MPNGRDPYPSDVSDEALAFCAPQREVFNGVRWVGCSGCPWRMLPHDLRVLAGREKEPAAAILDSRTLQSTPESGRRAGYYGYKRHKGYKGSKIHAAVDTLGHLLAFKTTPTSEQCRADHLQSS